MEPKDCKVLFYSEDGIKFKLFIEGKEIAITNGLNIYAGNGGAVEVTPTLLFINDQKTIRDPEPKITID